VQHIVEYREAGAYVEVQQSLVVPAEIVLLVVPHRIEGAKRPNDLLAQSEFLTRKVECALEADRPTALRVEDPLFAA
jgi:hypothetical protein